MSVILFKFSLPLKGYIIGTGYINNRAAANSVTSDQGAHGSMVVGVGLSGCDSRCRD